MAGLNFTTEKEVLKKSFAASELKKSHILTGGDETDLHQEQGLRYSQLKIILLLTSNLQGKKKYLWGGGQNFAVPLKMQF